MKELLEPLAEGSASVDGGRTHFCKLYLCASRQSSARTRSKVSAVAEVINQDWFPNDSVANLREEIEILIDAEEAKNRREACVI